VTVSELPANSEKPEDRLARLRFNATSDSEEPAPEPVNPAGNPPDDRRCTGITEGRRCLAWAVKGETLCAGHLGLGIPAMREGSRKAAEARREARLSVRERALAALDDDWPDVLAALRRGLKDGDARKASQTAVSYVQLVFGKQLQKPEDEKPASDPLEIGSMTRVERDELKRKLLSEHPELAERLRLVS
jgi:hypothetical protein